MRSSTCARRRLIAARMPRAVEHVGVAQRGHEQAVVGIDRDADVDVRVQGARRALSPSNHALSAGTALHAATMRADQARGDVLLAGPRRAGRRRRISVVGTTFACASAITRAMLRRTPLSCSGWPVAATPGGCVRIGLPVCDSVLRAARRGRRRRSAASARRARATGAAPALRAAVGRRALHVVHRHHAIGAGGAHAGDVDAQLARQRAHRRHRLDAADRDRGFAAHRVGASASRRPRCRCLRALRYACRPRPSARACRRR